MDVIARCFVTLSVLLTLVYVYKSKWTKTSTDTRDESSVEEITVNVETAPSPEIAVPFPVLLADYRKQLKAMKDGGKWLPNPIYQPCDEIQEAKLCVETNCNGTVSLDPVESLTSILRSMEDLDLGTLAEVTRLLRAKHTHKVVLFVSAASSNHYRESQFQIQNLHDYVFPHLTSYSFVYYDLGLTYEQRTELEQYCGCEVRTFPMSAMPARLKYLKCYTWKPLIIHANLPTADTLIWMDASVRFRNRTILDLLQHVDKTRLAVFHGGAAMAYHTHKTMFQYFQEQTCSFSHVPEISAGFAAYKNDRFIREAVIKPWAACAFSPQCMCPNHAELFQMCKEKRFRTYNFCHRFDQSALGIILSKLFRGYETNLKMETTIADIKRGDGGSYYFNEMKIRHDALFFKNFP